MLQKYRVIGQRRVYNISIAYNFSTDIQRTCGHFLLLTDTVINA